MTEVEKLEIEKENFSFHLEKSDVKHLHPPPILLHYYVQPSA